MNAHARNIEDALPYSIEAEQGLLGAVLLKSDCWYDAAEIVEDHHFFEPLHRKIWAIISERLRIGQTVEIVPLIAALGPDAKAQIMEGVTIGQYIARMAAEGATAMVVADYARTVRDLWRRRELVMLGRDLIAKANGGFEDNGLDALIDEADQQMGAIRDGKQVAGIQTIAEATQTTLRQTSDAFRKHVKPGFGTGVETIDELLGPMMPGNLITILGASGNGKTALAAQIITNITKASLDTQATTTGVFVSQEMTASELARREIATMTGISTVRQMRGEVTPAEYEILAESGRALSDLHILIDQSGRQPVSRIVRKLRALKRRHNIGFAVVDHLLLIAPEHQRMGKIETIENASAVLKDIAKELDMAILLLAQVTREGQKRESWRLRDTDLYGGDAVKQNSDVLATIAIPRKFLIQREPDPEDAKAHDKWHRLMTRWNGKAEIGALKVRDGEDGGYRELAFDGNRVRFSELI